MAKYKVTEKTIYDYTPDPSNANKGSEEGQAMIEDSLHEVGPGRSLVADKNDVLAAGNKTQQAALDAGITQVIEVETDGDAIIVHKRRDWDMTKEDGGQARRYAYFDNRASQLSMVWDALQVKADLDAGINLKGIFDDDSMKKLMNKIDGSDSKQGGNNTSSGQVEKAEEIREKWGVEAGQLWLIPSKFKEGLVHRVLCGDSTKDTDVDRLMNGRKAALSVTSPPYSVNKDYEKAAVEDWLNLIRGVFTQCARVSDLWFVNLADRRTGNEGAFEVHTYGKMIEECAKLGYGLLSTRIWKKPPVWGTNPYWRTTYKGLDDFEYLALFGREAPKRVDRLDDQENTDWGYRGVWEFASVQSNSLHSAQYPVELPNRAMRMLTDYGDLVHDPFGGSGTTMKAAELIGREAYLMELMPHYTAVVLETMHELGLEPELEA